MQWSTRNLVMRLRHQLEYLQVDDEKADALPDERGAHVAGESGRGRRVISLLIGLAVGDLVWHVLLLKILWDINRE